MKNIVKFVIPFILVIAIPIVLFLQKSENEIQQIDRISKQVYNEFKPTGISISVIQDNEIIYEKSFGYKNIHNLEMLNHNDIFNIASCTKAFTAAAIGKLVQEGLLSWNDKIIDYVPGFKLADEYITKNLEIKDMLSHRTGLGTFYGDLLWYNTDYSNAEVIERMQYLPITKNFRSEFGYQNNMYLIAGEIIQNVTGQSWERFIQQNFFEPLEMNASRTSSDQFDGSESTAFPHLQDSAIAVHYFHAGKPAISIWSNARDLSNWTRMLLNNGKWKNNQILQPEIIETLTSAHTILPVSKSRKELGIHFRNYALGWNTFDYNGLEIISHDGSMPGFISNVTIVPEKNLSIVILNNGFDFYANDLLLYAIIDIITEKQTTDWVAYFLQKKSEYEDYQREQDSARLKQRTLGTATDADLKDFAGSYYDKMYGEASVHLENNDLHLILEPGKKVFSGKLEHWDYNNFKVQFKDPFLPFAIIRFDLNENGKPVGFKVDLPSNDFHFENLNFRKI